MNILSLFDGMSCGQIAIKKAGVHVDRYFASEIDKHAIAVTQKNFPNTVQLGDICKVHVTNLGIEVDEPNSSMKVYGAIPDIVMAGSPCQGFSRAGKGLNFEDERSKLFFEFIRILKECKLVNPNVIFLLENVDMIQEWQDIISKLVDINPIKINSALVSAQNRVRLYWTDINKQSDMFGHSVCGISQPRDLGMVLNDILESDVAAKYFLSEKALERIKNFTVNDRGVRPYKDDGHFSGMSEFGTIVNGDQKTDTLTAAHEPKIIVPGVINENEFVQKGDKAMNIDANYHKGADNHGQRKIISIFSGRQQQDRVYASNGKLPALLSELGGRNNVCITKPTHLEQNYVSSEGKAKTLVASMHKGSQANGQSVFDVGTKIRRLTPRECERLQGVPDDYTASVSDTQRYRMLGNGWQVDTIVHILKHL